MIDKDFIDNLRIKWQTTEINVLREYVQHLFLANLYKQREAEGLFFKGGTALRVAYQSPRFSEDLDFSSAIRSASKIEDLIQETLLEMDKGGIKLTIAEAKKTSGGYLFDSKTNLFGHDIEIKLNFVIKNNLDGDSIVVRSVFIPPYNITVLKQESLIGEKIQAFLTRGKTRDWFDLYFIIRANLGGKALSEDYEKAIKKVEKTKINFSELKTFLPHSFWPVVADLRKNLLNELKRV
ncbi:hypothetical protein COW98_01975 [Candidatus Roizmanbacteria bacterium CG22_combo_CG10-13_8_21_14_all_35_9]|uniref:Nucleotidyl transferase AbiEii/AbiGii toxin family protein n=4 Tax=Patescibacteria group TaxID=1783273 RepID=A0A1J4T725_9BACT|nr:nucleotidyl transferase AbiEii/AbiGii toxin family protein [Candidatus Falkowbacteria bacterium]OIO07177.1 MAG: hypothetical protein AUJ27_02965 [Candidatus Falkowbacteria bacterium CG1_02_37_44]PIP62828.1 MAG: hypothetical protein COW98_01975 [Candidatus Roizmanbacteria bacterium CG22_combo_CG10-13_8_21_14_all_35_9]PIY71050.1 MAG: hypothetical protein COY88_02375 [Candidatus Roizmanbacteria bacterium CG_4_10_14_0_8_um_filter_35_28]PJC33252.1 MAG: hypothetical protein CO048_03510 [Candidatus